MAPSRARISRQPHQAQLLPRHGKNEIRVPGGQGRRGGALGLGPLEVSLARDLARTNGQQAALLLESLSQGVQPMVEHHQKPHAYILRQPGPEQNHRSHARGHLPQEPEGMNPRRPEHHQVDRQIDRHHANVPGHPIEQRAQGQDMEQQQKHRLGPVQSLLPQLSQLKSQQEQKGDFDHLRRLQIESAPGQGDPALVPGSVVIAQGDQQEQKPHIDHRQQPPQLLQQLSHIQHGQKQAQDNPSPQRHSLLSHQAMEGFLIPGGAENQRQAIQRRTEAEKKQRPLPLFSSHGTRLPSHSPGACPPAGRFSLHHTLNWQ